MLACGAVKLSLLCGHCPGFESYVRLEVVIERACFRTGGVESLKGPLGYLTKQVTLAGEAIYQLTPAFSMAIAIAM